MKTTILSKKDKKLKKLNKKLKKSKVDKVDKVVNTKFDNNIEMTETVTKDRTFRAFGRTTLETLKKIKKAMIQYYTV